MSYGKYKVLKSSQHWPIVRTFFIGNCDPTVASSLLASCLPQVSNLGYGLV